MLLIILSWIYISFIFFSFGLGVTALTDRIIQKNSVTVPNMLVVLLYGMVATAVTGSLLSLVMPLSALANGLILLIAVGSCWVFNVRARAALLRFRADRKELPRLLVLLLLVFVFVVAYLSADVSSHYDDGLYYATTIQWIEQFGMVKGVANVNPRIGFNSTWMLLNALFSFRYLHLGNFNDLNGLLLLYVMAYSLGALNRLYKRDHRISVIVRALFILPLSAFHFGASSDFMLFNINFLSSPTADLPVCMLLWLVFVWLLELDERPEQEHHHVVLDIVIISLFLFIIKPSAAPILLACIYFFFKYIFKKRFLFAGAMCAMALLVVAPWVARNILISGYVIFPFPAIDIIHADWKLPIAHARWHENAVRVFAIGDQYDLNKPFTVPMSEWFPLWFEKLTFIQSLVFIFSSTAVVTFIITFVVKSIQTGRNFIAAHKYFIFSVLIAVAGSIFWFLKGPDFRLGYGFTGMLTLLLLAMMFRYFLDRDVRYVGIVLTGFFIYMLLFYYKNTLKETARHLFRPLPERRMPEKIEQVKMGNGAVMNIVFKQDSWYAPLPVTDIIDYSAIKPVPRGATIKDGFKSSEKK